MIYKAPKSEWTESGCENKNYEYIFSMAQHTNLAVIFPPEEHEYPECMIRNSWQDTHVKRKQWQNCQIPSPHMHIHSLAGIVWKQAKDSRFCFVWSLWMTLLAFSFWLTGYFLFCINSGGSVKVLTTEKYCNIFVSGLNQQNYSVPGANNTGIGDWVWAAEPSWYATSHQINSATYPSSSSSTVQ